MEPKQFSIIPLSQKRLKPVPEAKTFGEKDLTSEEYRKAIILLFSYSFWYQIQREEIDGGIDDYTDDLNAILDDCNYSNLYYGNPFDWMFLFCAQSKQPLELFRNYWQKYLNRVSTKVTDSFLYLLS